MIVTRAAGGVFFEATLLFRGDFRPERPAVPVLTPDVRSTLAEVGVPGGLLVRGDLRAMTEASLGMALDAALGAVSTASALSEAVLETRAVRFASPNVPPAELIEELALLLWDKGIETSFGRSWSPVPAGCVGVGAGGEAQEIREIIERHILCVNL